MKSKIWKHEDLVKNIKELHNKKIILVGGCFDLVHYGHHTFLKKAKMLGDVLVVLLESDEFISKTKKRDPIHSQMERAEILASFEFVDVVILLPKMDKDEDYDLCVKVIQPSIIAVSEGDSNKDKKKNQAIRNGAQIQEVTSIISRFSTRSIIDKIN